MGDPSGSSERTFRGDLEGLRAVAVALVLLYHAGVPGIRGGYVGVDVFFVLSGFLITGLLVAELRRTGGIDLGAFYARRLRRLLPASFAVLVATAIGAALLAPPLEVPSISLDIAAAALYASNVRFALEATDYLQVGSAPSPVLHYWSLGVEEQFYLVWPALLLGVAVVVRRMGSARREAALVAVVATTWIASLVLGIVLTGANGPWAFFSLPTRAWQLATGALVALAGARLLRIPGPAAAALAWAGLAAIGLAGLLYDDATPFPGTAALLPTLGAALVIVGGSGDPAAGPGRHLARRVPRWIGRISYSLYLWHWPVLALPALAAGGELPLGVRLLLAVATVPLAHASHRWIEEPIRHGRFVGTVVRRNLRLAATATLVTALAAGGLGAAAAASLDGGRGDPSLVAEGPLPEDPLEGLGVPGESLAPVGSDDPSTSTGPDPSEPAASSGSPVPSVDPNGPEATFPPTPPGGLPATIRPSLANARDDLPVVYGDGCHLSFTAVTSGPCVYGDASANRTVVLFGDSHAAQWLPALDRLGRAGGFRVVSLTKSSCGPADATVWNTALKRAYRECDTWRAAALARIGRERPALVVAAASDGYTLVVGDRQVAARDDPERWNAALRRGLAALLPLAGEVALLADTPRASGDPPACVSKNRDDLLACATPLARALAPERRRSDAAIAAELGARFADPTRWVCPTAPCPVVIGRYLVYRDGHHITATYSVALARRLAAALGLPDGSGG